MAERLIDVLINICGFAMIFLAGGFIYRLMSPFICLRKGRWAKILLLLLFSGSCGMVIWIGDPNVLYTMLVFFPCFFLITQGQPAQQLSLAMISFCYIMSVCSVIDSYVYRLEHYDYIVRLLRPAIFGGIYFLFRKRLPGEPLSLSPGMWKLMLGLAAMPFFSLIAVVGLTYYRYESVLVEIVSRNQGLAVLPVILLGCLLLLRAILALSDYERLQSESRLSALRELYYDSLQREQNQVRTLRHDMRNHMAVLRGLLERGETAKAAEYAGELLGSPALSGGKRICAHEAANAVLSVKLGELERLGIPADYQVSLPEDLNISDTDLCALLGNALDNAMEACAKAEKPQVRLRCRLDKGMLMLIVSNPLAGDEKDGLSTTKADVKNHGFGLPGMAEIARRLGGSLDACVKDGRFELVACIPHTGAAEV